MADWFSFWMCVPSKQNLINSQLSLSWFPSPSHFCVTLFYAQILQTILLQKSSSIAVKNDSVRKEFLQVEVVKTTLTEVLK